MRNELTQIEYIELYLEGKLSAAEKATFEQRIQSDAALKEAVDLQKIITERIEINALKNIVQQVHRDKYSSGFNLNSWLIILLVCIGIAFAGWSYFRKGDAETVSATRKIGAATIPVEQGAAIDTTALHTQQQSQQQVQPLKETSVVQKKHAGTNAQGTLAAASTQADPATKKAEATADKKQEPPVKNSPTLQFNNKKFAVPFAVYAFKAENGGTFTDKRSGSTITVPAGILTDTDGKPVKGDVKLYYREFRDAADMAYSGIPMIYKTDAGDFRFNSAGMFELHVLKNNDSLAMRKGKGVRVDFMMTQTIPGTVFYKLNDKRKNWSEIGKIEALLKESDHQPVAGKQVIQLVGKPVGNGVFAEDIAVGLDSSVAPAPVFYTSSDRRVSSLLAAGANKGHSYPALVSGLVCKDFGVYNCDQIYRIGSALSIQPVFKDASGNVIGQQNILTMIDLNYNGSFSFDPYAYFQINPAAKNVLLLFTSDNKIFSYTAEDFKKQPLQNGPCTFIMGDITERVKNTEDLRSYLGLEK
ncbi:MAG: hypothetical protein JWP12_3181 [Bacteroidetes bacterium]|nr:hypothetical protein [Bacteroidota bacterium]